MWTSVYDIKKNSNPLTKQKFQIQRVYRNGKNEMLVGFTCITYLPFYIITSYYHCRHALTLEIYSGVKSLVVSVCWNWGTQYLQQGWNPWKYASKSVRNKCQFTPIISAMNARIAGGLEGVHVSLASEGGFDYNGGAPSLWRVIVTQGGGGRKLSFAY